MKLPGQAWLQFETRPEGEGRTLLTQVIFFAPKGLLGFLYWYVLYPAHLVIFRNLIKAIGREAEMQSGSVPAV